MKKEPIYFGNYNQPVIVLMDLLKEPNHHFFQNIPYRFPSRSGFFMEKILANSSANPFLNDGNSDVPNGWSREFP